MPLYLVTKEYADEHTLMHYRTKGSKNGVRRYQYEDGSLTPEGYIHYGIGKGNTADKAWNKARNKAEAYEAKAGKYKSKAAWQKNMHGGFGTERLMKKAEKIQRRADEQNRLARAINDAELSYLKEEQKRAKQEEQETARRVDNNPWIDGTSGKKRYDEARQKLEKYDELGPEEKQKAGDTLLKTMSRYIKTYGSQWEAQQKIKNNELDDLDADAEKNATADFYRDQLWVLEKIDKVSGNENTGEYKEGSRGEAAHKTLMQHYDKLWDREEEVKRNIGYQEPAYNKNGFIANQKKADSEYQRLKAALASDEVYQALEKNSNKSEKALLNAVLRDLGFSTTPTNRDAIAWIVFRD